MGLVLGISASENPSGHCSLIGSPGGFLSRNLPGSLVCGQNDTGRASGRLLVLARARLSTSGPASSALRTGISSSFTGSATGTACIWK